MTRPTPEIDAYLDGDPTPEETRALEAWIQADPANAHAFLAAVRLHQQIAAQLRKDRFDQALTSPSQPATTKDGDAAIQALASLVEMEAAAEPLPFNPIDRPHAFDSQHNRSTRTEVSLIQALDDLRWATGKLAGRLIRSPQVLTTAAAAILLLALILINPFTNNTPAPPQTANNTPSQNKPAESAPPILRDHPGTTPGTPPVTTLTAQHNAQWAHHPAEGALAPGSELHPNTPLTLTAGFAEITTNNGAIAIIQAPATIELINNNALHLHAGKLVGICETDASKGFLVRTPHMDITDLGTRFGVDATDEQANEVHVYEGQVQLDRSSEFGTTRQAPEPLVAGQAMRFEPREDRFIRIDADLARFAAIARTRYLPISTGYDLQLGDKDPNWRVTAVNGQAIVDHPAMLFTDGKDENRPKKLADSVLPCHWLEVPGSIASAGNQGRTYTCQAIVQLPAGFDPQVSELVLIAAGGRAIDAVRINGQNLDLPQAVTDRASFYSPELKLAINPWVGQQMNTIEFDVYDTDNDTRLRAAIEVRTKTP